MKKEPKLLTLLACDQVITDKDNKHSIIGIFTQIFANNFPAAHPHMTIFLAWLNNGVVRKSRLDIKILDDLKQPLEAKIERHEISFEENKEGVFGIFNFNNVIFKQQGNYTIAIDLDEQRIGELPIKVGPRPN